MENSTIEQQKCKTHEKRDQLLVSEWSLIIRILIEIKKIYLNFYQ